MYQKIRKTVVGTGAAINVVLGFIPDKVTILNTATLDALTFGDTDADNTLGVDVTEAGVLSKATAGIVVSGLNDSFQGFVLSATAATNVDGDDLIVEAEIFTHS